MASRPPAIFSGKGTALFASLSFSCVLCTDFCCLWWSGRGVSVFQVCICLKRSPPFLFSLLCVFAVWLQGVGELMSLSSLGFAFPSGVF